MGSLILWLIGKGVPQRFARPVAYAGLALVILAAFATAWSCVKRDVIADHQAKIERRAAPATEKAADERATDAINQSQNEKDTHDAIQAQPDQPIAPTSRVLACQRLRNAGRNPPACR